MTIIERIEQLNFERGWSLYELSKRTEIAEATVYIWKRKGKNPSIATLEKICGSYGITMFQFFGGIYAPELTQEQNELIASWSVLSEQEKAVIKEIIEVFKSKK